MTRAAFFSHVEVNDHLTVIALSQGGPAHTASHLCTRVSAGEACPFLTCTGVTFISHSSQFKIDHVHGLFKNSFNSAPTLCRHPCAWGAETPSSEGALQTRQVQEQELKSCPAHTQVWAGDPPCRSPPWLSAAAGRVGGGRCLRCHGNQKFIF